MVQHSFRRAVGVSLLPMALLGTTLGMSQPPYLRYQHKGYVQALGHASPAVGQVVCCDGECKYVRAEPAHRQQWVADTEVLSGRVKWFSSMKGYGFVRMRVDNGFRDYFVHQSDLCSDGICVALSPGEALEFRIAKSVANGKEKAMFITAPGGAPLQSTLAEDPDATWAYLFDELFSP